jgi:hypothetical protein
MTPWFGPKSRYDTGIASWQGWLALLVFLGLLFGDQEFFRPAAWGLPGWAAAASKAVLLAGFLGLVWLKYDRDPD